MQALHSKIPSTSVHLDPIESAFQTVSTLSERFFSVVNDGLIAGESLRGPSKVPRPLGTPFSPVQEMVLSLAPLLPLQPPL